MGVGLDDLPARQSSLSKQVSSAEAENIPQERTLPTQLPSNDTITDLSQQTPPTARSKSCWGASTFFAFNVFEPITKSASCWAAFTLHAFNVFETNGDKAVLWRRICMIGILFISTAGSIIKLWADGHQGIDTLAIGTIISILAFFFEAHWLARIGEFTGRRKVFGKVVGRNSYDIFLTSMFALHLLIFTGLLELSFMDSAVVWILMMWWAARIARKPDIDDGSMA